MIHATVHAGDAEAAQRQVDRLLEMLQQMLHDAMRWVALHHKQQQDQADALRIWMVGKDGLVLRPVYGPTPNGQHCNDLTPERLRTLLDALQQPVPENLDRTRYAGRRPAIVLKVGNLTLFRQEQDGTVSINQIQASQQVQQPDPEIRQQPRNHRRTRVTRKQKGIELE